MATPSERDQTPAPEYEPRKEEHRMKNKSNNRRFKNLVEIPTKDIESRRRNFEKKGSQESYSIINVNIKKTGVLHNKYELFPDPFGYFSSILEVEAGKTVVKYYFNNNGQAMKIEVDTKRRDSPPSHLTPEDYIRVDKVLVNIESGEYKTPF